MKKKIPSLLLSAALAVSLLAGCGGNPSNNDGSGSNAGPAKDTLVFSIPNEKF